MQLWVSKLNKNKWKITLIILSVALITSCIFGFTAAWFNKNEQAKVNVGMDVQYVDIFATNEDADKQLIPAMYYTIDENKIPKVAVGETDGTYCVFIKIKETGGDVDVNKEGYLTNYIDYKVSSDWNPLSDDQAQTFGFKTENRAKYYYQNITANQQEIAVFVPYNSTENSTAQFQAKPGLTLAQVYEARDAEKEVKLSLVAAGCRTTTAAAGSANLPTAQEVALAEVYTAFF